MKIQDKLFANSTEKRYLSQNLYLKMIEKGEISIIQWVDTLLAKGVYGFSKKDLQQDLPYYSEIAAKRALSRLSAKGKIVSLYKGYYLILTPQYSSRGILPVPLFLDAFMKYLERPYYVALLNAAAYHGAAHQQPQEFFVITRFPVLRPTKKKGLKVNYISIKHFPETLIEKRKTEAGYLNVSKPILTACDLIQFEKRVGGLNRAGTVLNELSETIHSADFSSDLIGNVHITTLQRLGYLLEHVCFQAELADALFEFMKKENLTLFRIPLKPTKEATGYSSVNRWNVIVNAKIEIEE